MQNMAIYFDLKREFVDSFRQWHNTRRAIPEVHTVNILWKDFVFFLRNNQFSKNVLFKQDVLIYVEHFRLSVLPFLNLNTTNWARFAWSS